MSPTQGVRLKGRHFAMVMIVILVAVLIIAIAIFVGVFVLSRAGTSIVVTLHLNSPSPTYNYSLYLNGVRTNNGNISQGNTTVIKIPIKFSPISIGQQVVSIKATEANYSYYCEYSIRSIQEGGNYPVLFSWGEPSTSIYQINQSDASIVVMLHLNSTASTYYNYSIYLNGVRTNNGNITQGNTTIIRIPISFSSNTSMGQQVVSIIAANASDSYYSQYSIPSVQKGGNYPIKFIWP